METFSIDEIRTLLRGASSTSHTVSDFEVWIGTDLSSRDNPNSTAKYFAWIKNSGPRTALITKGKFRRGGQPPPSNGLVTNLTSNALEDTRRVPGLPIGSPYWELCGKLQQFGSKGYQAERNRCDSKSNLWAFVFGSRTEPIWAPSQLSLYTHTPTAHSTAISRFLCNFFS